MFYEKLEKLCQEKGISLRKLTGELNISNANATFWKNGSIPRKSTIKKIADYFCVPVEYFYDTTPVEPIPAIKKETAEIIDSPKEAERRQLLRQAMEMASTLSDDKLRRLIEILKIK